MERRERGTAGCGCFRQLGACGGFEVDWDDRRRVVHNEKPLSLEHPSAIQVYLPDPVKA